MYFAFIYVCAVMCAVCPWQPEEGNGSLEVEFTDVYELPFWYWEQNPGPLGEAARVPDLCVAPPAHSSRQFYVSPQILAGYYYIFKISAISLCHNLAVIVSVLQKEHFAPC